MSCLCEVKPFLCQTSQLCQCQLESHLKTCSEPLSIQFSHFEKLRLVKSLDGQKGSKKLLFKNERDQLRVVQVVDLVNFEGTPNELLRMLTNLSHRNVMKVLDLKKASPQKYLISKEYGENSFKKILLKQKKTPSSEPQIVDWFKQLCEAALYLVSNGMGFFMVGADYIYFSKDNEVKIELFPHKGSVREWNFKNTQSEASIVKKIGELIYRLCELKTPGKVYQPMSRTVSEGFEMLLCESITGKIESLEQLLEKVEMLSIDYYKDSQEQSKRLLDIADLFFQRGDYEEAEKYLIKCKEIREATLPSVHQSLGVVYHYLASLYCSKKELKTAEFYFDLCKEIFSEVLPSDNYYLGCFYLNLGVFYKKKGDFVSAETFYLNCEEIFTEVLQPGDYMFSKVYLNLGVLYKSMGHFESAKSYFGKCEKIRKDLNVQGYELACVYLNMGILHKDLGNTQAAIRYYESALKEFEAVLDPNHYTLSKVYLNIGILYKNKGNLEEAQKNFEKCMKIRLALGSKGLDLAVVYANIGVLSLAKKSYKEAEECFSKSETIYEKCLVEPNLELTKLYYHIGELYTESNHHQEAQKYFVKCYQVRKSNFQVTNLDIEFNKKLLSLQKGNSKLGFRVSLNLGNLFFEQKNYKLAEDHYTQSLQTSELLEKAKTYNNLASLKLEVKSLSEAEEHYNSCKSILDSLTQVPKVEWFNLLMNLGNLYRNQGRLEEAKNSYLESQKISQELNSEALDSSLYMNLGVLYDDLKDYEESIKHYNKSKEIKERLLGHESVSLASIYNNLGVLYKNLGKFDLSLENFSKCEDIRKEVFPEDHLSLGYLYENLGNLWYSRKNFNEADKYYSQAFEIYKKNFEPNKDYFLKFQAKLANFKNQLN